MSPLSTPRSVYTRIRRPGQVQRFIRSPVPDPAPHPVGFQVHSHWTPTSDPDLSVISLTPAEDGLCPLPTNSGTSSTLTLSPLTPSSGPGSLLTLSEPRPGTRLYLLLPRPTQGRELPPIYDSDPRARVSSRGPVGSVLETPDTHK